MASFLKNSLKFGRIFGGFSDFSGFLRFFERIGIIFEGFLKVYSILDGFLGIFKRFLKDFGSFLKDSLKFRRIFEEFSRSLGFLRDFGGNWDHF